MAAHPARTILHEQVCYVPQGKDAHLAFVIKTFDDDPHSAVLVYYCPFTHSWRETERVRFGEADDRDYYVNTES
jgi:hypothetical protein